MNYQNITIIGILLAGSTVLAVCNTTSQDSEPTRALGERPTATELLAEMDTDNDGELSVHEVSGPLMNDFARIDTDADGFLSEDELDNAPEHEGPPDGSEERIDDPVGSVEEGK